MTKKTSRCDFSAYVKKFDTDNDNVLSSNEIAGVTQINVYNTSISNLTGIEYFTALETLCATTTSSRRWMCRRTRS